MRILRNKYAVIWLFGLFVTVCFWTFNGLGGGQSTYSQLNTLVFDSYQRIKPREWSGTDLIIVDIDEASIKQLGQWPWPRTVIAELTDRLGNLGAAAIVFDIVFSEPDRTSPLKAIEYLKNAGAKVELPHKIDVLDNDTVLASSFERNYVVGGMILSDTGTSAPPVPKAGTGFVGSVPESFMKHDVKAIRNLAVLEDKITGLGDFGFSSELQSDAVIRKVQLLRPANNQYYPTLAMETLRMVQGAGGFKLKSSDASGELSGGNLTIVSAQVGAFEIPTDKDGAFDIYHSPSTAKPTISAHAVLSPENSGISPEDLQTEIANHIVLIGTSAAGLLDLRATPLEPIVPGVSIHAEIIDQIISQNYLSRPDTAPGIELTVAIIASLLLLLLLAFLNPVGDALATITMIVVVVGGFWYGFTEYQLLFSPVIPVISIFLAYAAGLAADLLITERQGRFVRDAFSLYLSPAMVERLADNPEELVLGGEEKQLTILFCDIRGFTALSEGLEPTELTELLNNFLTPMTEALLEQGATIDKYMGDAIMAFWNAPIGQKDHAQRACKGLMDMRRELVQLNERSARPINIGIGLNTGPCCVGNLGSSQRFSYSAIGDAVNVSSRIEGLTKQYGVDNLIAEETLVETDGFATIEVDRVSVVGRAEPLTVHSILGDHTLLGNNDFEIFKEAHDDMINCYRSGDIEDGIVAMAKAGRLAEKLGSLSLMKLYAIYGERFSRFRTEGIPDSWDGVYHSQSK